MKSRMKMRVKIWMRSSIVLLSIEINIVLGTFVKSAKIDCAIFLFKIA